MADGEGAARVCPFLRGRYQPQPVLSPSDANHCVLVAFIHLPQPQQSRHCLGGQHESCSRFIRQKTQPLPRYLTGIPSPPAPPPVEHPDLPTLWWRKRFARHALQLLVLLMFAALLVVGWRWRSTALTVELTPRPPLPTAIPAPAVTPSSPFFLPTYGPPAR